MMMINNKKQCQVNLKKMLFKVKKKDLGKKILKNKKILKIMAAMMPMNVHHMIGMFVAMESPMLKNY